MKNRNDSISPHNDHTCLYFLYNPYSLPARLAMPMIGMMINNHVNDSSCSPHSPHTQTHTVRPLKQVCTGHFRSLAAEGFSKSRLVEQKHPSGKRCFSLHAHVSLNQIKAESGDNLLSATNTWCTLWPSLKAVLITSTLGEQSHNDKHGLYPQASGGRVRVRVRVCALTCYFSSVHTIKAIKNWVKEQAMLSMQSGLFTRRENVAFNANGTLTLKSQRLFTFRQQRLVGCQQNKQTITCHCLICQCVSMDTSVSFKCDVSNVERLFLKSPLTLPRRSFCPPALEWLLICICTRCSQTSIGCLHCSVGCFGKFSSSFVRWLWYYVLSHWQDECCFNWDERTHKYLRAQWISRLDKESCCVSLLLAGQDLIGVTFNLQRLLAAPFYSVHFPCTTFVKMFGVTNK